MKKSFKKIVSAVLVVLILLSSAPLQGLTGIDLGFDEIFSTEAEAATGLSGYYADAAAAWAKAHWNDYDSVLLGKGYWNKGGDCANFVSQCLYMGGMDMEKLWHTSGYYAHWTESGYDSKFYGSFIRVDELYNYLVEKGATVIVNPSADQVSIGDVLLYAKNKASDKTHSAIVVDKVNGVPKIAYHSTGTTKECTLKWHLSFKGELTFLIKLSGKTCKNGTVKSIDVYTNKKNTYPYLYKDANYNTKISQYMYDTEAKRPEYTHVYKKSSDGKWGYTFRYGKWGWIRLSQFTKQGSYSSTSPGHTYGSWTVTQNPTCTAEGSKYRTCTKCGHKDYGTIAKKDHTLVAASCTKAQYCSVCNTTFGNALGHDFPSEWTVIYDSTCTWVGIKRKVCTRCGLSKGAFINPKGHSMGDWYVVEEATCTKEGLKRKDCTRTNCDYYETKAIPVTPHNYGDEIIVSEPTCTEAGQKKRVCADCGHEKFYSYGMALGHDMGEWYVETAATEDTPGVERSDCQRTGCDHFARRIIAEHDHEYGEWTVVTEPTCTVDGYRHRTCSICLYNQVDITVATGHKVNVVEFGSYPQSRVEDEELLTELNSMLENEELISYEYYYGDGSIGSMQQGDYMKYCDVELNGEKYRYVDIVKARPLTTIASYNEDVPFDSGKGISGTLYLHSVYSYQRYNDYLPYDLNGTTSITDKIAYVDGGGERYWFKYEPIEWRVLDQDTGLVLCETIIDAQPYAATIYGAVDENGEVVGDIYGDEDQTIFANDYTNSNIREWLNSDFYATAFSEEEQGLILTSDVDENKDKIFVLSYDELTSTEYYFDSNADNAASRVAISSDYAQCQGVLANTTADRYNVDVISIAIDINLCVYDYEVLSEEILNRWWTRTTVSDTSDSVRTVDANGNLSAEGEYTYEFAADQGVGIRPAMRLDCVEILRDDKAPTCTEKGYIGDEFCYVCGEQISTGYEIAELGHDFVECTNIAPTCTEKGLIEEECTRCGLVETVDEPDALGHEMGDWYLVREATCVEEGLERSDCLRENCEYYEENILPIIEHTPVPGTGYEPTCENDGLTPGEFCDFCGTELEAQEVIPALGHTGLDENGEEVWVRASDPICSTPGRDELRCTRIFDGEQCNHLIDVEDVPALEPDFYESYRENSTCEKMGFVEYVCANCNGEVKGHKYMDFLDIVEHTFGEWETIIEPICVYGGLKKITCTVCGYYETEEIEAPYTEHDLETVTVSSTCVEGGHEYKDCTRCDHTEGYTELDPTGHNLQKNEELSYAATCVDEGLDFFECINDGCDFTSQTVLEPLGHIETYVSSTAPTCTEAGFDSYKCQRESCEYEWEIFTEEALGHNEGEWVVIDKADCTTEGEKELHCTRVNGEVICDARIETVHIFVREHNWSDWVTTVAPKCEEDGLEERECLNEENEEYEECQACEENVLTMTGHDWDDGVIDPEATCKTKGTKTYTCQNDNSHTYTESVELNPDNHAGETYIKDALEPTCTDDGYTGDTYCSDCDVKIADGEVIPATDHDWDEGVIEPEPTCKTHGTKTYTCQNDSSHTYTEAVDFDMDNHEGETYIKDSSEADCENDGYTGDTYCGGCDAKIADGEVIPASGHAWDNWYTVTSASCEEDGLEKRVCKNDASHQETKVLPAINHDWGQWDVVKEATYDNTGLKVQTCKNDSSHINTEIIPVLTRPSDDNDNIETDKTVDYDSLTGEAVIRLLASSKGETVTVKSRIPLDIVLVLDQSGSMEGELIGKLKTAAAEFTTAITNDAAENELDHRIAMVGFAMQNQYNFGSEFYQYRNTEVLTTGGDPVMYNSLSSDEMNDVYKNALVYANVDGVNPVLTTAIDNIEAKGATAADLGLDMACKIFSQNENDGTRKRIVVFMTDGEPTYKSGYMEETAENAISKAELLKSAYEADIYSVGVLSGSDTTKAKTFLKEVSSEDAEGNELYFDCSDSQQLIESFKKIAEESTVIKTDFDDITLVDTVSAAFTLTYLQEQKLRVDAIESLGVTNEDITVTRYEDGTTEIKIEHISPKKVEKDGEINFVVDFSFSVSANEKALTEGSYVTNTENAGLILGVKDVYENNFAVPDGEIEKAEGVIYFNVNGITYHVLRVHAGDEIKEPEINVGGEYSFSGWDIPDEVTFEGGKCTLEATLDQTVYTVTWVTDDETTTYFYHYGDIISAPEVGANKTGDIFVSWDKTVPTTMPAENLTFTAVYGEHTHSYTETVTKKASCGTVGEATFTCLCGDAYSEELDALEHSWATRATTSDDDTAFASVYCLNCGESPDESFSYTVTGKVGRTEYSYNLKLVDAENITIDVDGNITVSLPIPEEMKNARNIKIYREEADGSLTDLGGVKSGSYITFTTDHFSNYIIKATYECNETGNHIDENCDKLCDICGGEYGNLGHKYTSVVTAPDCDSKGYTTYTCTKCGNSYKSDETSATGHKYTSTVTSPTCTAKGYTTYKCSKCGDTYTGNEKAALGHKLGAYKTVEAASCDKDGFEKASCTRCTTYSETRTVKATGHDYQDGVCTRCGSDKTKDCSCNCHKGGIAGFFFKLILFFQKIFKSNKVCSCGKAHY